MKKLIEILFYLKLLYVIDPEEEITFLPIEEPVASYEDR